MTSYLMKNVLVTGASGFIGRNLVSALERIDGITVDMLGRQDDRSVMDSALSKADIVFHLAGVSRPKDVGEFSTSNVELTQYITKFLGQRKIPPKVILPSSIQATFNKPYGVSKRQAEDVILEYHNKTGASVAIYRLPGVFGKWSQPNYNTVVATFCYNIARGIPITVTSPNYELDLVYIDDVVAEFLQHLDRRCTGKQQRWSVERTFKITLGVLVDRIKELQAIPKTLLVPNLADDFMKCLHATYLSFLPEDGFSYPIELIRDERGWLFEFIKSKCFGQIFVSKTLPGVIRGNHYHDTKVEKFCVIQGQGIVRFRHIYSKGILEYPVDSEVISVVDIPPGYTHSIENNGDIEMICLFWANQIFSSEESDTYREKVL